MDPNANLTPAEQRLAQARVELEDAQTFYPDTEPSAVKMLQARVDELVSEAAKKRARAFWSGRPAHPDLRLPRRWIALGRVHGRVASLKDEQAALTRQIDRLTETIDKTPTNAIALAELERNNENIQAQFNQAVDRLAQASTGERIEVVSRGERITVIEQPAVPSEPTKPNRVAIAGLGTGLGVGVLVLPS